MANLPDVSIDEIPKYSTVDISELSDDYLEGKLGEVVDAINVRWGTAVAERLRSGALPRRLYDAVVVRVAARVFGNVDGFRRENEGQYGYELHQMAASGYVWFSDIDERDLTGVVASKKPGRAGTAMLRRAPGWR